MFGLLPIIVVADGRWRPLPGGRGGRRRGRRAAGAHPPRRQRGHGPVSAPPPYSRAPRLPASTPVVHTQGRWSPGAVMWRGAAARPSPSYPGGATHIVARPPPHPYQCGLSLCAREAKGRVTDGHEGDSPRQCTRWPDPRAAPPRAGTSCRGAPPAAPQTHRTTAAARAAAGRPAAQPAARREPSLPSGNARERQTSSPPRLAPPLLVIARLALPPLPPHPPPIPAGGSITRPPPPQYA